MDQEQGPSRSGRTRDVVGKAGEAVAELTEEITKEAQAAKDLEAAQNTLKDQERDFIKQRAETNKLIAESRLLAEDDTLAVGERVKALQKAVFQLVFFP